MRRVRRFRCAVVTLLGLFAVVSPADAQLHLVARESTIASTTLTPPTPSVEATMESAVLIEFDVPPVPSSDYVLLTTGAIWSVYRTGFSPQRGDLQLRYNITSPALPAGIVLRFGVPLTRFEDAISTGIGLKPAPKQ